MTKPLWALAALFAAASAAVAQDAPDLNGRKVTVTTGAHASKWTPISLETDAAVAEGAVIDMVQEGTGKEVPATLRDGVLTFVPEGSPAETTLSYVVRIKEYEHEPNVRIQPGEKDGTLDVFVADELLTTFHYSKEFRKPFLWPLNGAGGVPLTRAYPVGEQELTKDHPHHKSFWTAYGNLNGVDCWAEGENAGNTYVKSVSHGSGRAFGWIAAEVSWQDKEGKEILTEAREYRFYNTPAGERFIDVKVDLAAAGEDVKFGDTKEGGIVSFRMRDTMTEKNGGTITLSEGRTGEANVWGKASPWCDYSAPVDEKGVHGIAVFDHPGNLRYPSRWHVRAYGLMGANPFGLSDFTENDPERLNGDYLLKTGDRLVFNYRVFVHLFDAEKSQVAHRYDNYAHTPAAAWAG